MPPLIVFSSYTINFLYFLQILINFILLKFFNLKRLITSKSLFFIANSLAVLLNIPVVINNLLLFHPFDIKS